MESFNLGQAILDWRKDLQRYQAMEPGFIEELESSLHDYYEEYLIRGCRPDEAFEKAKLKVSPDGQVLAREFSRAAIPHKGWKSVFGSFSFLLPSYLKVALRNLRRKRSYNLINFICLTVGILTTSLAVLYLDYETSYDDMIPEVDRKYRLGRTFRSQDYSVMSFDGYFGAAPEVQLQQLNGFQNIKGVEQACQFYTFWQPAIVKANEKELTSEDLLQTNTPTAFFDFFGWSFIKGSVEAFSQKPNTLVLTEKEAIRIYGVDWTEQPNLLEQIIEIDGQDYALVGVIEDIPSNVHFDFSMALYRPKIEYWGSRTYVKLAKGEDPATIAHRMDENMAKINTRLAESELFGGTIIQPLRSIHLNSDMLYELKPPGDKRYLYIIGIISAIILSLTISNYTNLSVAMNASRAREIGMRKIFGATEGQVSRQFVLESIVLSLLTLPIVALALQVIIPWFNTFMGTGLNEQILNQLSFWLILVYITLVVGLLASLYPSLFLARYPVLRLFRGDLVKNTHRGFSTRKAIISFQFVLLIGLCSLTLLVNQQLRYIQTKDLGFDKEQVVYINLSADSSKYKVFKNELLQIPEVTGVGSGSPLGRNPFNQTTYKLDGTAEVFDDAYDISLDYGAIDLLNIETSIPDYVKNPGEAPKNLVLINETLTSRLCQRFDLQRQDLVGRQIIQEPEYTNEETGELGFPFTIGGFFKDINMFSLREEITPMFLTAYKDPDYVRWVSVAWEGVAPNTIIDKIRGKYRGLQLDQALYYSYLTQNIEELYAKEQRIARLSIYFSLVAFAVAIIGLIALTAYLTTLKRKEIGIRQILGASQLDILKRFNREYLGLIGISLLIAAPLTWYGVSRWLSSFAYRIDLNPLVFLLAGVITLLITSAAVSIMTLKAARAVPVDALQETQ